MGDEDETPRGWRQPRRLTESQRQRDVYGVPITGPRQDDEEPTSPIDLLDREPDERVHDIVRRSKRESGASATVEDLIQMRLSWERNIERERSASKEASKVLAMLPSPEELKEMRENISRIKMASIILKAVAVIALAAAGYVVKEVLAGVKESSETQVRLRYVEQAVNRIFQPRLPTQKD